MTYRGPLNVSSCQETAIAPRSHARASRRARTTSLSYLADRIRITDPAVSRSSNVSMTDDRNARCFFGDSVSMCALSSTEINVNSTDGGGISPTSEGGRPSRSGNTQLPRSTPHKDFIRGGNMAGVESVIRLSRDLSQSRNGPLSGAALCCTIPGGASPERVRNLIRLPEGFGFTAPSRLHKPVSPPIHHLPCREIHGDDLGHVCLSNPASPLVERHPVSAT